MLWLSDPWEPAWRPSEACEAGMLELHSCTRSTSFCPRAGCNITQPTCTLATVANVCAASKKMATVQRTEMEEHVLVTRLSKIRRPEVSSHQLRITWPGTVFNMEEIDARIGGRHKCRAAPHFIGIHTKQHVKAMDTEIWSWIRARALTAAIEIDGQVWCIVADRWRIHSGSTGLLETCARQVSLFHQVIEQLVCFFKKDTFAGHWQCSYGVGDAEHHDASPS